MQVDPLGLHQRVATAGPSRMNGLGGKNNVIESGLGTWASRVSHSFRRAAAVRLSSIQSLVAAPFSSARIASLSAVVANTKSEVKTARPAFACESVLTATRVSAIAGCRRSSSITIAVPRRASRSVWIRSGSQLRHPEAVYLRHVQV